jgi:pentatricopeptide repeat protein
MQNVGAWMMHSGFLRVCLNVSWNAMISALAFHGQALEALSLFRRMSKDNGTVQPNDITFIGVLVGETTCGGFETLGGDKTHCCFISRNK